MSHPPFTPASPDHAVFNVDDLALNLKFHTNALACVRLNTYPALGMDQRRHGAA